MTGEIISLFDPAQPPSEPATGQPQAITLPAPAGWPAPPDEAAYHGLPGAIVQKIAPHTEADPVAILAQLLVVLRGADRPRRSLPDRSDPASPKRVRDPDR